MKENLCFGCEHVWYDNGGSDHCPLCGSSEMETADYQEGYDDGGDISTEWANDINTEMQ